MHLIVILIEIPIVQFGSFPLCQSFEAAPFCFISPVAIVNMFYE